MTDASRHKPVDTLRGYVRDAFAFCDHAGAGLLWGHRRIRGITRRVGFIAGPGIGKLDAADWFRRNSGIWTLPLSVIAPDA